MIILLVDVGIAVQLVWMGFGNGSRLVCWGQVAVKLFEHGISVFRRLVGVAKSKRDFRLVVYLTHTRT